MSTNEDPEILELADTLSAKLLQNAEFIETAYDCLKTYKHQSMALVVLFLPLSYAAKCDDHLILAI
jgi:hypothetical protein